MYVQTLVNIYKDYRLHRPSVTLTISRKGERMGSNQNKNELIKKICEDTWKELYRFIYYKVQNREDAQDITQETYARAISYLSGNDTRVQDYNNYLKTISMNIIRDQWRVKQRRGIYINLEELDPEEFASEDFSEAVGNRELVEAAIKQLSKDQQQVISLRIIKGYSVAATAGLMKKKEGTNRVLQYRAIKELTRIIEAMGC
jgi:RNA polymerase sigma-70 factor (ECF subfamily)